MSTGKENMKLACVVQAWAATARSGLDSHPESDTLLDYFDGALQAYEAESLRDHLALCPECSQRGLDLALFSQSQERSPDDFCVQEVEREWAATRQALESLAPSSEIYERRQPWPQWWVSSFRSLWRPSLGYAAASLFFVSSLGLSVQLMQTRAELKKPQGDVQLVDLLPIGTGILRDASASRSTPITAANGTPLVLILSFLDPVSYTSYRVEIRDVVRSEQKEIWSTDDLKRSPEGNLTVFLPQSGLVTEGSYRVRLFGIDSGQQNPLAEYELQIDRQ